jgi:hypothetical protein
MDAATLFDNKFNSITSVVEFNPDWNNGTGYFDASVQLIENGEPEIAVSFKPGEMAKSISPNNRKMIFVGTDLGTCVVFQRYSNDSGTLVTNQARSLRKAGFIENGALTYDALKRIIGGRYFDEPNIGATIARVRWCLEAVKPLAANV